MLIWITAPAAAIGVFLVALSVVWCAPSSSEPEQVVVSGLPFAAALSQPCSPGTSRDRTLRPRAEPRVYAIAFYKYMAVSSNFYKQVAQRVANQSSMNDCGFLDLPVIQNTPKLSELMEVEAAEALQRIHSSLLLHAAYAYFVDHQFATVSGICSENSLDKERNLAREALILAKKQKQMACMTQMTMEELGFTLNVTNSLLNERFANLRLCSRRALRDCQIMLSISHLLDVVGKYSNSMVASMELN